jgi:hypothetical protein
MAKMMKAAVVEKPNVITVKQVPVPQVEDNEVTCSRTRWASACCSSW